jgi:hypothetical protein
MRWRRFWPTWTTRFSSTKGTIVADGKPDQAMLATLRDNDIFLPKNARVEDLSWLTP